MNKRDRIRMAKEGLSLMELFKMIDNYILLLKFKSYLLIL